MKTRILQLGLILIMFSCGGETTESEEHNETNTSDEVENIDIDVNDESVTIDAGDGTTLNIGTSEELPENYPEYICPLYEDASIFLSSNNFADDKNNYVISYGTMADVKTVKDFYHNFYNKSEIVSNMDINGSNMTMAEKDGFSISITIAGNEDEEEHGQTSVSLVVAQE